MNDTNTSLARENFSFKKMKNGMSFHLKTFINECLHDTFCRKGQVTNGIIVFIIVFSLAITPLRFVENAPQIINFKPYLNFLAKINVTIFTVEYLLRIWSAKHPLKYIFSWWSLVDFLALLPFYLVQLGIPLLPELFLIFRMTRVIKLSKIYKRKQSTIAYDQLRCHGSFCVIEGENLQRIIQKHPSIFFLQLLIPIIFLMLATIILAFFHTYLLGLITFVGLLIFIIIFFIKIWLDYNYDVLYVTNYRVVIQMRDLFGSTSNNIRYETMTGVEPSNMGLVHTIFRFGDISIYTATGTHLFRNAAKPHEVVQNIAHNRQKAFERNGFNAESVGVNKLNV